MSSQRIEHNWATELNPQGLPPSFHPLSMQIDTEIFITNKYIEICIRNPQRPSFVPSMIQKSCISTSYSTGTWCSTQRTLLHFVQSLLWQKNQRYEYALFIYNNWISLLSSEDMQNLQIYYTSAGHQHEIKEQSGKKSNACVFSPPSLTCMPPDHWNRGRPDPQGWSGMGSTQPGKVPFIETFPSSMALLGNIKKQREVSV